MNNKVRELVYTLDDNYLIPFLVSAFSAKKYLGPNVKIIIVQPLQGTSKMGLSTEAQDICKKALNALCIDFEMVKVDVSSFSEEHLPLWARFPKTTWLRYYYIFNADITQRIIYYVEADMIFLKSSPNIFDVKLAGSAVSGRISPGHEQFEEKWEPAKKKPWYFNCGVMVINLSKWREIIDQRDWWKVVSEYKKYEFSVIEQDALNYFFRGTQVPLNPELNTYPTEYEHNKSAVVHFAGHLKPWNFKPTLLRFKEKPNTVASMRIWDSLEKEVSQLLTKKLTDIDIARIHRIYPNVKLSTKLSILFPAATGKVYSFKQMLALGNKKRKINEN